MSYFPATRAALARHGRLDVFFRDDDAGWGDDRLLALCDVFADRGVPLDLAVIPASCSRDLAQTLLRHRADLSFHQHGFAHVNHQEKGRKSEFGDERLLSDVTRDIVEGRRILVERFGDRVQPIFTPPWNRCRRDIAAALLICDLTVLSRDRTAAGLEQPEIMELPISVDVVKIRDELDAAIAAALTSHPRGRPFGFMLHHAVHDAFDRTLIGALLDFLLSVSSVQLTSMGGALSGSVAA